MKHDDRTGRAIRATIIAQCLNWLSLLLSLVTVPWYLSCLGQERYGLVLTATAIITYLMLSKGGIAWASMLLISNAIGSRNKEIVPTIMKCSYALATLSACVAAVIVVMLYSLATQSSTYNFLPKHSEFPGLLISLGIFVCLNLLISPIYNLLAGLQDTHLSATYQGIGQIAGTILACIAAGLGFTVGIVFFGHVIATTAAAILATWHAYKKHRWALVGGKWWDREQIHSQLRGATKCFAMQAGGTLNGTAPVLALSFAGGPDLVPLFSVPMALLQAPLGIAQTFNMTMQPAYGEAFGAGENGWIAARVGQTIRLLAVWLGLLASGYLLLSQTFIEIWTVGKLSVPFSMVSGILLLGGVTSFKDILRFSLTGINRHHRAAMGELVCGVTSLIVGASVVAAGHASSIGWAIAFPSAVFGCWYFSNELSRHLRLSKSFWPPLTFIVRLAAATIVPLLIGILLVWSMSSLPEFAVTVVTSITIAVVYVTLGSVLLRSEIRTIAPFLRRYCDLVQRLTQKVEKSPSSGRRKRILDEQF